LLGFSARWERWRVRSKEGRGYQTGTRQPGSEPQSPAAASTTQSESGSIAFGRNEFFET